MTYPITRSRYRFRCDCGCQSFIEKGESVSKGRVIRPLRFGRTQNTWFRDSCIQYNNILDALVWG
jgi:hypothetical protein